MSSTDSDLTSIAARMMADLFLTPEERTVAKARSSGFIVLTASDLNVVPFELFLPVQGLDFYRTVQYTTVNDLTPADLLEALGAWHDQHGRHDDGTECLKRANDWREATYGTASVFEIERMRKEGNG